MWDMAQEILNSRVDASGLRGKQKSKSMFFGRLVCMRCCSPYRANSDGKYKFYNCGTKRENGLSAGSSRNVSEKK